MGVGDDGKPCDDGFTARMAIVVDAAGGVAQLAQQASLSRSVIHKYLNGESDPSRIRLIDLAQAGGVRLLWLATGQGPMRVGAVEDQPTRPLDRDLLMFIAQGVAQVRQDTGTPLDGLDFVRLVAGTYEELCQTYESDQERRIGFRIVQHRLRQG